jgi:hypothetical protein
VIDLSFLPSEDAAAVTAALAAARRGLGEKLRAALLVGAAVPPARHAGAVGVALLLVVSDLPVAALGNLARQLRGLTSARVRARVLTERELLRSADVFALELAEMCARHLLLDGIDPLRDLHFTRADLRRSIEQTLRALSWRLRDGALEGAVDGDTERARARALLASALAELSIVAHHTLTLLGESPPSDELALLDALARHAGVRAAPLQAWIGPFRAGTELGDPMAELAELLEVVEAATALVDGVGADD